MDKRAQLLEQIAKILEVPSVTPETKMEVWDSLNVMMAVVAIDDIYGKVVHGKELVDAVTVADILKVAEQ